MNRWPSVGRKKDSQNVTSDAGLNHLSGLCDGAESCFGPRADRKDDNACRYAVLRGWEGRSRAFCRLLIRAASAIVNHDIMVLFLGLSAPSSAESLVVYCCKRRENSPRLASIGKTEGEENTAIEVA